MCSSCRSRLCRFYMPHKLARVPVGSVKPGGGSLRFKATVVVFLASCYISVCHTHKGNKHSADLFSTPYSIFKTPTFLSGVWGYATNRVSLLLATWCWFHKAKGRNEWCDVIKIPFSPSELSVTGFTWAELGFSSGCSRPFYWTKTKCTNTQATPLLLLHNQKCFCGSDIMCWCDNSSLH